MWGKFFFKAFIRLAGIFALVTILPLAAVNPTIANDQWIVWSLGIVLALNIILNEPQVPDQGEPNEDQNS